MKMERAEVVCPFYRFDDDSRRITCEGLVEGSVLVQQYSRRKDLKQQLEVFCQKECEHCEVFRMILAAKYE